MEIVINNVVFPFNEGCRVLKLKGGDCPLNELKDFWDDIEPMTFVDIAKMSNLEQRRIAIGYLGIDEVVRQVNPIEIDRQAIFKKTTWINEKGVKEEIDFKDVYELFKVSNRTLIQETSHRETFSYFVKCKDTSTDREYLIWVDLPDVNSTNGKSRWNAEEDASAIDSIAWTITTNVPQGNIEKIVRQGDCILVKPINKDDLCEPRHLTGKEYLELLELES
jgi:hypothetical protein